MSFGPTARLSFSSISRSVAVNVTGTGADNGSNSAVAVAVAPVRGVETGDLTDEHVMKFQIRCLSDSVD